MIYEMVVRCVDDLKYRWIRLRDVLAALRDSLPDGDARSGLDALVGPPGQQDANGGAGDIGSLLSNIHDPREHDGRGDIRVLISNARATLNDSDRFLGVIESAYQFTGPDLRNSGSDATRNAARTVDARMRELRQHIDHCLEDIELLTTEEGQRASVAGIRDSVGNISAYPLLTQEAGFPTTSTSPGGLGGAGTKPLGAVVENTLRDVLGWKPKTSDPKGFLAALTQSFSCQDVEGHVVCKYTPRTYAVQVQADMGAVTGAQASIYNRAKAALDESTILLDRLRPLDPAADMQNVEADRAIVRSELTELVNELGIEGGPRVLRVDALFEHLLGYETTDPYDPEQVTGQLGEMRKDFGLTRDNVITVEEEQNLTDFITLVDYINSLKLSWDAQRPFFDRSGTTVPFLGTQLVLVSRELAVISESVQEVYYAMDSVFLGPSERQTIPLTYEHSPPIFVGELLAWADRFASEEGPRLIQDAGKFGVRAFFPTIDRLRKLVTGALIPPQVARNLPEGYATERVQRAIRELAEHLDGLASLASPFRGGLPNGSHGSNGSARNGFGRTGVFGGTANRRIPSR